MSRSWLTSSCSPLLIITTPRKVKYEAVPTIILLLSYYNHLHINQHSRNLKSKREELHKIHSQPNQQHEQQIRNNADDENHMQLTVYKGAKPLNFKFDLLNSLFGSRSPVGFSVFSRCSCCPTGKTRGLGKRPAEAPYFGLAAHTSPGEARDSVKIEGVSAAVRHALAPSHLGFQA